MRCQDFERLILEAEEKELGRDERLLIDEHLILCPECAAFRDFSQKIRFSLRSPAVLSLPSELDNRTRLVCHAKLGKKTADVPWMIWVGFAGLTLLTVIFFIPRIDEFWQNQKITLEMALGLVLLIQNALMLFFAPVVVRRQGLSRDKSAVFPALGQGRSSGGSKWPLYQGK